MHSIPFCACKTISVCGLQSGISTISISNPFFFYVGENKKKLTWGLHFLQSVHFTLGSASAILNITLIFFISFGMECMRKKTSPFFFILFSVTRCKIERFEMEPLWFFSKWLLISPGTFCHSIHVILQKKIKICFFFPRLVELRTKNCNAFHNAIKWEKCDKKM